MITTFRVQNYKALRDVTLQLTPMHLLIGPNDSGKTSILEALAALSRLTYTSPKDSFGSDWEGRELVWKHSDEPISFSVESEKPRWTVNVYFAEKGRVAEFNPIAGKPRSPFSSQESIDESKRFDARREEMRKLIAPVEKFAFNARLMSLPSAADPQSPFRLDTTGFGLPRCLDYLVGTQRKKFRELENWFQRIFPHITDLVLTPQKGMQLQRREDGEFHIQYSHDGKALSFAVASIDSLIPARQISDGVLIILAFLTILSLPDPPKLLLIEEPENGIHPERLERIMGMLRELLKEHPETQVVLTSHSPYIVSLFEPEEVTLCRKNEHGEVQVRRLSESEIVKDQLKVFSLGEIWPSEEERIFKESNDLMTTPAEASP